MKTDRKTIKFQMMMSPADAAALDDWMFKNRLKSRAEAIRRLCAAAMTMEGPPRIPAPLYDAIDDMEQAAVDAIEAMDEDDEIHIALSAALEAMSTAFGNVLSDRAPRRAEVSDADMAALEIDLEAIG